MCFVCFTLKYFPYLADNDYRKVPKFSDRRDFAVIHLKFKQKRPILKIFYQKHANGIANSEDLDQTAPLGAVGSGSALFAQTYLSENLGSLLYNDSTLLPHHNTYCYNVDLV